MSDQICNIAIKIHKLLGLSTYSRNDFLVLDDKIYFLESNTLPGMTTTSLLPRSKCSGINFQNF